MVIFLKIIAGEVDFNRWDNYERHTIFYWWTHNMWLKGLMPFINFHQHLGEHVISNGQSAALYFPLTIIVLFMKIFRINADNLPLLIFLTHIPFMMLGWYFSLKNLNIRKSVAFLGAISITTTGYVLASTMVWIHHLIVFSYIPWLLLCLNKIFEDNSSRKWNFLFALFLMLACYGSHIQIFVYLCIFLLLYICFCFTAKIIAGKKFFYAVKVFIIGLLFCLPAILPVVNFAKYTQRQQAFPKEVFLQRSLSFRSLSGIFLPVYRSKGEVFDEKVTVMPFMGGWILLPLLWGFSLFFKKRKFPYDKQLKHAGVFCVLSFVFFIFSLGRNTPVYSLTYGLPCWSSFRWPFKFLFFATASLGIASTIFLDKYITDKEKIGYGFFLCFIICVIAFVLSLVLGIEMGKFGLMVLFFAFFALILTPLSTEIFFRRLLLSASSFAILFFLFLIHKQDFKRYRQKYGLYTAETFGIKKDYRVFTTCALPRKMQECANHCSATINGYSSITGDTVDFSVPWWYLRYIPSYITGVLDKSAKAMLGSNFLRSLNGRYVIVYKKSPLLEGIKKRGVYNIVKKLDDVVVLEDKIFLKKVYFATALYPFDADSMYRGLIENKSPLTSAYVAGIAEKKTLKAGKILGVDWGEKAKIKIKVNSRERGFLVISALYYPHWKAKINGIRTKIYRVNGVLMGIFVPAGKSEIEFVYRDRYFYLGLAGLFAGFLFLLFLRKAQ